jgi:hypothetical protein
MNKIINIRDRIEGRIQERKLERYRGKMETIQTVAQCSSCHFRCAMCGLHLKMTDASANSTSPSVGFIFCESCREEFENFLSISGGEKKSDIFWHNKEWMNMWSAWINYQKAIKGFINSPEFKSLRDELDT